MTLYAGEEFRITATGSDFDGTVLTEDNVSEVSVTIFDSALEEIIDAPMSWEPDELLWYYMWDTTGLDPGSYRYRVTFTGLDLKSSWEWKRVRFARNPV